MLAYANVQINMHCSFLSMHAAAALGLPALSWCPLQFHTVNCRALVIPAAPWCSLQRHDAPCSAIALHAEPWCSLQACSGAGKNEEAVKGMEQLCGVKAEAAGASVVRTTHAAGVSLEARLQVSNSPGSVSLVLMP